MMALKHTNMPDVETESGIYINTKSHTLKIPSGKVINIDEITYVERVLGWPGEIHYKKLFQDGKSECYNEFLSIGSTQHDYYDYMDHNENELHIEGENFSHLVKGKDAEFLWAWFLQYFH